MDLCSGGRPADSFARYGAHLARGLFPAEEVTVLLAHVRELARTTTEFFRDGTHDPESDDPLRRWPRMIHPHLKDRTLRDLLLDDRIRRMLVELLGKEPLAVQSMVYFKPPGSRGQALHQDQRYLRVSPGTCVAAWLALEDCDPGNGGLRVVPGSHVVEVLCPVPSDTSQSFTPETVPVPQGMEPVDVVMQAGDVLFFHGKLIHGSGPNTSPDRFRTIAVGHYATADAQRISDSYPTAYTFDGDRQSLDADDSGGPCGVWEDGTYRRTSTVAESLAAH